MAIRAGVKSRSHIIAELGMDVEDVDREITEDNKRADENGLVFDSDARNTTGAGVYQSINKEDEEAS